ncbi:MAG: hypothetical protein ACI4A5_03690, partial [Hominilimicola sp.]
TDTSSLSDRIGKLEEKIKNGVTVNKEPVAEKKKTEEKKKTPVRLYRPIPGYELISDNPIVKTAKNWDNISRTMCNSAGHLIACLRNRPITIDADGIILLFKREEKGAHDIAANFKDKLQQTFKRASGTEYAVKLAYEDEIQEELVDFWNLPSSGSDTSENSNTEHSGDPLDNLVKNFGEIIEDADESEFVEYNSAEDSFSQSSFDEDDDREEFLDQSELSDEDENN